MVTVCAVHTYQARCARRSCAAQKRRQKKNGMGMAERCFVVVRHVITMDTHLSVKMSSSAMGAEKVMSGARNGPSKQGHLARQLELRAEECFAQYRSRSNSSWGAKSEYACALTKAAVGALRTCLRLQRDIRLPVGTAVRLLVLGIRILE